MSITSWAWPRVPAHARRTVTMQHEVDVDQLAGRVITADRVVPSRRLAARLRDLQHILAPVSGEFVEVITGQLNAAHMRADIEGFDDLEGSRTTATPSSSASLNIGRPAAGAIPPLTSSGPAMAIPFLTDRLAEMGLAQRQSKPSEIGR